MEVGAGLGSLTLALAATGARVIAVEIDRRLSAVLREVVAGRDVEVIEADALRLDWGGAARRPARARSSLVANLPYSVATPVVVRVLEEAPAVERLLVMVQREVGERWVARPGDPAYGAVSVKIAYWDEASARRGGCRPPSSSPGRRSTRCSCASCACAAPAVDPDRRPLRRVSRRWCGPGSRTAARCSGGRSPGWSSRGPSRRPGWRPERPGRGARRRGVGPAGPERRP